MSLPIQRTRWLRPSYWHRSVGLLLFLLAVPLQAQVREQRDPVLDRMAGGWTGTCDVDSQRFACDREGVWVLGDSFLRCESRIYRDRKANAVHSEYVEYYKRSGDEGFSLNVFGSDGVSRWGTVQTGTAAWEVTVNRSDGLTEAGVWSFPDASTLAYTGTVHSADGEPAKTIRYRLRRR